MFVRDLTVRQVRTADELEALIVEGSARRTVAETKMNSESSRSHSVLTITLAQVTKGNVLGVGSRAVISLVDLAGSERASENSGTTLKEGIKINSSLTALGNVMAALVDGNKHVYVLLGVFTLFI